MKFTTRRAVCSSSAPCKYEKICVNFHGLVQEQRCVVCFETCAVIWKIYLAELLLPSYSFSGFSGSFTAMGRKDIRLKKRIFICQSTECKGLATYICPACNRNFCRACYDDTFCVLPQSNQWICADCHYNHYSPPV